MTAMPLSARARAFDAPGDLPAFAAAVRTGLGSRPRQLPPRWLYDDLGSALFEAICALPWYRVTRAEHALLAAHAPDMAAATHGVDFVVELGPGSGEKLAMIVSALGARGATPAVHLVDVSPAALSLATRTVTRAGVRDLTSSCVEYVDGIEQLERDRRGAGHALVAFLGSNIGNFHWPEAVTLLRRLRARLRPGDRVLLGVDLVKPEKVLQLAYDDPLGVTAAFNKNLLVRMNRELGSSFDLATFEHRAIWNAGASRVEMHLSSLRTQRVEIPGARCVADFDAGESIWTESSYKYERSQLDTLGTAVGLSVERTWLDEDAAFALTLFGV
jgi:dimethylhistidine N-methyltransferase